MSGYEQVHVSDAGHILSREKPGILHRLNVLCGTIGLFEITIQLNAEELEAYRLEGIPFIDTLAQQVRDDPQAWMKRNVRR